MSFFFYITLRSQFMMLYNTNIFDHILDVQKLSYLNDSRGSIAYFDIYPTKKKKVKLVGNKKEVNIIDDFQRA
jgi:hypothetical protein